MKSIHTTLGQSLSDVAVQEYGAYEGVFALLIDNEAIGDLSDVLGPGTPLNIREEKLKLNNENITIKQMMDLEQIGKIIGGLPTRTTLNLYYVEIDYVDIDYVLEF